MGGIVQGVRSLLNYTNPKIVRMHSYADKDVG